MERTNKVPQLTPKVIAAGLGEMHAELVQIKKKAEGYMNDLEEMKGDEGASFDFSELGNGGGGAEQAGPEAGPEEGGEIGLEENGEGEGKEKKAPKVETPEDAKKVMNEAVIDIQAVVDNLDGLVGQTEQEKESALIRRPSERYSSNLRGLAKKANDIINDANAAMKHWSFIKKAYRPSKQTSQEDIAQITNPELKQVANTIEQMSLLEKAMDKLGYVKKTATAVPPTGAEFSGDKWPGGKNPAEIELRHWHAGSDAFDADKKKEDALPNPAIEPRLVDEGNPHDDKPYVNAQLVVVPNNKFGSYWSVVDTKEKKAARIVFANIPDDIGPRNDKTFEVFTHQKYGASIVDNVLKTGIDVTVQKLGTKAVAFTKEVVASLNAEAREPKLKDKAKVRKYYKDAFGDGSYARELTSEKKVTKKVTAEEGAQGTTMDIEYTPEKEHPEDANPGEQFEKAKDGPGKMSSVSEQEKDVIRAKARRSVDLARKLASRGGIPFVKNAVLDKTREFFKLDDATFTAQESLLDSMPIVNEAALVETHIPDTETGIVGNTKEGVRNPKATVKTEDVNTGVKSDAKISTSALNKTASVVPQAVTDGPKGIPLSDRFTTTANRLRQKGVDLSVLRSPVYRRV